ncbi:hypothetical protein [Vibrio ziniensis]|uniref:Transmembrane protein n=1 Tax=Vibrio ziniensis TaxID=2711221 RepID=A0A6G7CEC0_9VIBR|nr:hypothetical protein [Vibrio ziniensis]QIH40465.1 hypothetical protein G5S32_02605 [Vibrio ziniensis]
MAVIQSVSNEEASMGCCNDEKCCETKNAKRRKFSWIGAVIVVLVVLVVTNWK